MWGKAAVLLLFRTFIKLFYTFLVVYTKPGIVSQRVWINEYASFLTTAILFYFRAGNARSP